MSKYLILSIQRMNYYYKFIRVYIIHFDAYDVRNADDKFRTNSY